MGKSKSKKTTVVEQNITKEEQTYQLLFDFAHYLENMSRGAVGGATQLLRTFLQEQKNKKDE
jgi:hypothetical protein